MIEKFMEVRQIECQLLDHAVVHNQVRVKFSGLPGGECPMNH